MSNLNNHEIDLLRPAPTRVWVQNEKLIKQNIKLKNINQSSKSIRLKIKDQIIKQIKGVVKNV